MRQARLFRILLAIGLGVVALVLAAPDGGMAGTAASAGETGEQNLIPAIGSPLASTGAASTDRAVTTREASAIRSLDGSSAETTDCYTNTSQVLCFTFYNGSTDNEWITRTRLTFPTALGAWTVSCHSQDATDSVGWPANLTCSNTAPNELIYDDKDDESPNVGEVTAGASWSVCANVTVPAGYNGDRIVNWGIYGDAEPGSSEPHYVAGTLSIQHCDPIMIEPSAVELEGCNGVTQTVVFELWNHAAGAGTYDLTYDVTSANGEFTGPSSFSMSSGQVVTFATQFAPDACVSVGDRMTATLTVNGNGQSDSATLLNTTSALQGWQARASSPVETMDNVVVWASQKDGRLWSIGGYGSSGAVQAYDPTDNSWMTYTSDTSPTIEYPMDGCYGLNGAGEEVVVLFPDTILTGSLRIFNIDSKSWYTASIPAGYFESGRWGYDVVSLLNVPGVNDNVCYLSGGSTQQGGGRTRNLHAYYPASNTAQYLGNFPAAFWFGFHSSWYVPWVGAQGAICVAGGVDHNHEMTTTSQCYDLDTHSFRTPNADLGPIPEPWWGMADGWQLYRGRYQIWMANGVSQDGLLLPASLYADESTGGFVYGPNMPVGLYRTEGDGCMQGFYTLGGSQGGFWYSSHSLQLTQCPWCATVDLPLVLRNY